MSTDEPAGDRPDEGVMFRPDQVVLPERAVVPEGNLVRPAPTRFTHELVADEPYWFDRAERADQPDGVLPAGTPVVVLVDGERYSRVVDGDGRYVEVRTESVRDLPNPDHDRRT